jgi:D-3-phosphoglycerate dehydrogenase
MGCLQAQLVRGPIKEVVVEFQGDFKDLDLAPVSTAVLKGILTPVVKDDVNFVNAQVMAQQRGITVTETSNAESDYYVNQITVRAISTEMESRGVRYDLRQKGSTNRQDRQVSPGDDSRGPHGTDPEYRQARIHRRDRHHLGTHNINIGRMQVGQEEEGDRNIVFLTTDTPIPEAVVEEMRQLSLVKTVTPLEF